MQNVPSEQDIEQFRATLKAMGRENSILKDIIEGNGLEPDFSTDEDCIWSKEIGEGKQLWAILSIGSDEPETWIMHPQGNLEEVFYGDVLDASVIHANENEEAA